MKRDIEPVLLGMLQAKRQREVILVEGARQVGKSTMVKQVLSELGAAYVAIDLEKDRKTARMIDKTMDFEDFRVLMQDRHSRKRRPAWCYTERGGDAHPECADLPGHTQESCPLC